MIVRRVLGVLRCGPKPDDAAIVLAVATILWSVPAGRRGTLPRPVALALGLTGPLIVVNFGLTNVGPMVAGAGGLLLAGA